MQPVNEETADDGTAQEAVARCVLSVGTLEAVRDLAQRMIAQLAKPLDTTIPIHDPRVRWKAFQIPLSSPDTSGRWGHEWPGSRLTGDDMRRLAVLGNYAKLPTNEGQKGGEAEPPRIAGLTAVAPTGWAAGAASVLAATGRPACSSSRSCSFNFLASVFQ